MGLSSFLAKRKKLNILGIRGIPAQHGGFETFAEDLSNYLIKQGWEVIVYCQEEGKGDIYETNWKGVKRVHIPVSGAGALSTIIFDFKCMIHSIKSSGLFLVLGYNTAIFITLLRIFGKKSITNMDGIEWKRSKWSFLIKIWFRVNEWFGCKVSNHLVADHPSIKAHLSDIAPSKKISVIPYGAIIVDTANKAVLDKYALKPNEYSILIARPEPENSILEVVSAFLVIMMWKITNIISLLRRLPAMKLFF